MSTDDRRQIETDQYLIDRINTFQNWQIEILSHANNVATNNFNNLIFLNGGTIPVLATMKGISHSPNTNTLFFGISLFIIGLIFALWGQTNLHTSLRKKRQYLLQLSNNMSEKLFEWKKTKNTDIIVNIGRNIPYEISKIDERDRKLDQSSRVCSFLSLLTFIFGAILSMISFYPSLS